MSRSQRAQDYDFGPYEDEYRGFEIRDDDSGRGPLILVLALGVLLIFAGVVWNTYRQGVRPAEGGLPVIAADDGPYKRAPDERGGLEVAGQDNGFYAPMDGMGDPATVKTSVRNPAEIRRRDPVLAGGPETVLPPVESATEQVDMAEDAGEAQQDEIKVAVMKPAIEKPAADSPVPEVEPEPVPAPTSRFASNGSFQVQLSALRSEDAAKSAWSQLQGSAPDLYQGAALDIQRADLGAKGVFYRLRVGSFDSRNSANSFCADVKATGKDCMVVAKANG